MNPSECEREPEILQAIRNGDASPDLVAHAQTCPVCSEVWLIAKFLQEETQLAAPELRELPDPGLIWRKAQAGAREQALAKATLPIRMMRTCALVLAILGMPWLVPQLIHALAWLHELGLGSFSFTDQSLINQSWISRGLIHQGSANQSWLGPLTGTTLLGISITLACIAVGSWYMLREK
ncbi:MAG TPA: hypothetical protein VMD99_04710 [Terriglobales bacterium]|nr:hypothetical protein [Terriglobales bacterium]